MLCAALKKTVQFLSIFFNCILQQILQKTDRLLKNASELDNLKHLGCDVEDAAKKIQGQISDFKAKMKERKELLDDAVKLHNIMEKV